MKVLILATLGAGAVWLGMGLAQAPAEAQATGWSSSSSWFDTHFWARGCRRATPGCAE